MSIRNINIRSPSKPKSANSSPYYIKDLFSEVIKKIGINYSNIEYINSLDTRNFSTKHINYLEIFRKELNIELDLLFNLVKTKSENNNIDKQLNIHITNLNDYLETIIEMINTF